MKVIVCGSRIWSDRKLLNTRLKQLLGPGKHHIVTGDAKGADSMAADLAKEEGWELSVYKADWGKHKKAAGPIRNKEMLDSNRDIELVIAFTESLKKSKGTLNMVQYASDQKYPVVIVPDRWKTT